MTTFRPSENLRVWSSILRGGNLTPYRIIRKILEYLITKTQKTREEKI